MSMQRLFDVNDTSFIDVDNPTSIRFAFLTLVRRRFDIGKIHRNDVDNPTPICVFDLISQLFWRYICCRSLLEFIPTNILRLHLPSWNMARLFMSWQGEERTGDFMIPTLDTCARSILTICFELQPSWNFRSVFINLVILLRVHYFHPLGLHNLYPRDYCRKSHKGVECLRFSFKHQLRKCGVTHPSSKCKKQPCGLHHQKYVCLRYWLATVTAWRLFMIPLSILYYYYYYYGNAERIC